MGQEGNVLWKLKGTLLYGVVNSSIKQLNIWDIVLRTSDYP